MTDSLALYSARRGLGILGGTFDPVHAGHLCLARAALDAVPLVRVELMPAGEPWQKSRISPGIHRLTALAPPPSAARLPENPLPAPCRRSTAGSTPALPPTSGRTDSISPRAINLK